METIKWRTVGLTSVSILLALIFLAAGGSKLASPEAHLRTFVRWGYPGWFLYLAGLVEVAGAVLLLIPAVRFYGAVLLACTMLGATFTHLRAGEMAAVAVPLVLLAFAGLIVLVDRPRRPSGTTPDRGKE
ncbi:MAG: DoxX family protein [Nitrospiraceae bacterium]